MDITRVGLDIAKNLFQVHGINQHGKVLLQKQISRDKMLAFFANMPSCLIGMEACSGAHYWARELTRFGHEVKLMAAQFVSPYRKRGTAGKNDRNDAEAICEAVGRPNMRFVPVKNVEQQSVLMVHRVRTLIVAERTALVNQIRGLLGEFGIVVSQGIVQIRKAMPGILEDAENGLIDLAREIFSKMQERLSDLDAQVREYDQRIGALAKTMEASKRLMKLPGVGAITATAIIGTAGDAKVFKNGRQFAAWLGMTPRQYGSGGKTRLGRISKRGDSYLRMLLIHGARAVLRVTGKRTDKKSRWAEGLKTRRGYNIAAVALAAKHARMIWVMLAKGESYRMPV
jgi:transposase